MFGKDEVKKSAPKPKVEEAEVTVAVEEAAPEAEPEAASEEQAVEE